MTTKATVAIVCGILIIFLLEVLAVLAWAEKRGSSDKPRGRPWMLLGQAQRSSEPPEPGNSYSPMQLAPLTLEHTG